MSQWLKNTAAMLGLNKLELGEGLSLCVGIAAGVSGLGCAFLYGFAWVVFGVSPFEVRWW